VPFDVLSRRRKQTLSHEDFLALRDSVPTLVPPDQFAELFKRTLAEVLTMTRGRRVGYAWSGGKDSIALELVMNAAGIGDCCFGMTNLEYQKFLVWVTDHMPPGLEIFNNGWDLAWLVKNQSTMLFPRNSTHAGKWFAGVQHRAQRLFAQRRGLDILITGRRKDDGNYVPGADGSYVSGDGIRRYAPLRDWRHVDVFAALLYHGRSRDQAPFYGWPRGYRVGTHAWPARQWCNDVAHGFAEVFSIEPARVTDAASAGLSSAQNWLRDQGIA
jgi:hypothetical protein